MQGVYDWLLISLIGLGLGSTLALIWRLSLRTKHVYCPHRHMYGDIQVLLRPALRSTLSLGRIKHQMRVTFCSLRGSQDSCDEGCMNT